MKKTYIIDSRGRKELFSFRKVMRSAIRSGASPRLARRIAESIQNEVYSGMRTREIYSRVRRMLNQEFPKAALRFSLKNGIRKLGPTGFPFEKYIAEIFSRQGFQVKTNQYIRGACLRYEIDFIAQKERLFYIGECKYRNLSEGHVHSDDALINYARFLDIQQGEFYKQKIKENLIIKSVLVTNTKFTQRAIRYSHWAGVKLLGWRYPKSDGLEHLIESHGLYPITILPSLNKRLADIFAEKKLMIAKDLLDLDIVRFSRISGISLSKIKSLIREAKILYSE